MSNPKGYPFDAVGKRFMKFAEKKLQKGINYLGAQANGTNTNYDVPNDNNTTDPDFSPSPFNTAPPSSQAYGTNTSYDIPNHYGTTYPDYNPSPVNAAPPPPPPPNAVPPPIFDGAPPPPAPFTEPFPQPEASTSTTTTSRPSNTAPITLLNASGPIITQDLLFQMQARVPSACKSLGSSTVKEARKGLSRALSPTPQDIDLFGMQLKNSQVEAVEPNWINIDDELPCFAISYVQHPPQGRYKFSDKQWKNFHVVVQAIAAAGVKQFRVWLDQCLWLRDASQSSWAHTGIVPYVLWPVIALGAKSPGGERTKDSFHRMWPFVEQIAGLWGMGLIVASEYRNNNLVEGDHRSWLSYNLRVKNEPEVDLMIIMLNIFQGAADALETGWVDDVLELKEMARANVMYASEEVIIGSDWKNRFTCIQPLYTSKVIENIKLPIIAKFFGGVDIYLDGSRTLKCDSWHGLREWYSGNEESVPSTNRDLMMLKYSMKKYNVMTNVGEYQLLSLGDMRSALWLVVAMQGRSSNFSRGRVAWTKVLTGPGSCRMSEMIDNGDVNGIQRVLRQELKNSTIRIQSANKVNAEIEWM